MTVIVLTKVPPGLRGHLTRWLMEVAPGVYVGHVSARVRDSLWGIVLDMVADGRALMLFSARNEQGMEIRNHGHSWTPEDFDGIALMRRPAPDKEVKDGAKLRRSKASIYAGLRRLKK